MRAGDPDYAISRLDLESAGTHGWQVRLQRQGVRYARFFSDLNWGGRDGALVRARQFRDRIVASARRSRSSAVRIQSVRTGRNTSGVVGVSRVSSTGANGARYHFWQASWSPSPGQRRTIRFSILEHGEDTAFELACEARDQGVREKL